MIFASAGFHVTMFDYDVNLLTTAKTEIKSKLEEYGRKGYLRGKLTARQLIALVSTTSVLS